MRDDRDETDLEGERPEPLSEAPRSGRSAFPLDEYNRGVSVEHDTVTPDVETASADYARRFEGRLGRFLLNVQTSAVNRLLDAESDASPQRVLEVGGGHGQLTPMLLHRGWEVCVQGSTTNTCEGLRPLVASHAHRLHLVTSSLWSLPFPAKCFDIVIAVRVLAHVARWRELLEEMGRVCRHQLIVDYPASLGVEAIDRWAAYMKRRFDVGTRPYFVYQPREVVLALRDIGFQRFATERELLVPLALHRRLASVRTSTAVESVGRALGLTARIGGPTLLRARRVARGKSSWNRRS